MLPYVALQEINIETERRVTMGTSYRFDFDEREFVIKDGRLVKTKGLEALKVWIIKILKTEKFRFKVYDRTDRNEYGVGIEDLIVGHNYPPEFIDSELRQEVESALRRHPMINSISNWSAVRDGARVIISFKANLTDGTSTDMEVPL